MELLVMIKEIEVSRFLVHFVGLFLITYLTKKNVMGLFKYNNFATLYIVIADILFSRYLINTNYDETLKVYDAAHSIVIAIVSVVSMSLLTFSDMNQLDNGQIGQEHKDLISTVLIYKIFNFYKIYYRDANDVQEFLYFSLVDFAINNAFFLIYNLINAYKLKMTQNKYLILIIKRIIFMMIVRLIYRYLYDMDSYYLDNLLDYIKSFALNMNNPKRTITPKTNYFNFLAYLAFNILELIN